MIDAEESTAAASLLQRAITTSAYLSEGVLLQLVFLFLLSPLRADPYIIAPLVALYALREVDKSAMKLYIILSIGALPLDLAALSAGIGFFAKLASLAALCLKVALLFPAVKAHDSLPAARPEKTLLTEQNKLALQAKVQEAVAKALAEELERLEWETNPRQSPAHAPPPPRPQASQATTPTAQPPPVSVAAAPKAAAAAAPPPPPPPSQAAWDEV